MTQSRHEQSEQPGEMATIELFDAATIDSLPWPATPDGVYARSYLVPLIRHGATHFIENAATTCMVLLIDRRIVLPITLNEREYANSYVCSPYSHYISYAHEELVMIPQVWMRRALACLIYVFGLLCGACHINRAVHVNNWLLSTNLYPELTEGQVTAAVAFLQRRFPRHTIIFRSLNNACNATLLDIFRRSGSTLVPSRQIYLVRPADQESISAKARWLVKRDLKLIEKEGYSVVQGDEIREDEIPRIVELYNALYLEKYSRYNPMFNEHFVRLALRDQILHLVACKKDDRIDAVLGYFCRNGVMTTPLFGYDTTLPQEPGLYRMLSALLFSQARENGHLLHESSGAAQFKRNRGAYVEIEYSAIILQHLPWSRRLCWLALETCLDKIAAPLLKKYKL